jgi:hypothetical protein
MMVQCCLPGRRTCVHTPHPFAPTRRLLREVLGAAGVHAPCWEWPGSAWPSYYAWPTYLLLNCGYPTGRCVRAYAGGANATLLTCTAVVVWACPTYRDTIPLTDRHQSWLASGALCTCRVSGRTSALLGGPGVAWPSIGCCSAQPVTGRSVGAVVTTYYLLPAALSQVASCAARACRTCPARVARAPSHAQHATLKSCTRHRAVPVSSQSPQPSATPAPPCSNRVSVRQALRCSESTELTRSLFTGDGLHLSRPTLLPAVAASRYASPFSPTADGEPPHGSPRLVAAGRRCTAGRRCGRTRVMVCSVWDARNAPPSGTHQPWWF